MHVLFLAPDTHVYNHGFVGGLKSLGAKVSAIGPGPRERLAPAVARQLDGYVHCAHLDQPKALERALRQFPASVGFDRVETIDEPLVEAAAVLRQHLALPGLTVATAKLCRDKVAMKEFLRRHDIPCAQSTAAGSAAEVVAFAERCGYPLVLKPLAGFGSLNTHRVESKAELERTLARMKLQPGKQIAVEEWNDGHEGFLDTITDQGGVRHDFASHYYPGCLAATLDRKVSPQIAVTNRIEGDGYRELRALGRRVIDALGIRNSGTHMEWFFGSKGLRFSEIGARPAGEKIWDLYRVANEFDVYREWALALFDRPSESAPSRRYAAGSVQIRPGRDGRYAGHEGLEAGWQRCRPWIYEFETPAPGTKTKALEKGWLCNTWFRLRHEDYDQLRELMTFLGTTVRAHAR